MKFGRNQYFQYENDEPLINSMYRATIDPQSSKYQGRGRGQNNPIHRGRGGFGPDGNGPDDDDPDPPGGGGPGRNDFNFGNIPKRPNGPQNFLCSYSDYLKFMN